MDKEQQSVWSKEIRDRARQENRAFNKFHKAHRNMDRDQARQAFNAGIMFEAQRRLMEV